MEPSEDIDDDSHCNCCLGGGDANGEQREEEALELVGEEQTVEHGEIDVNCVEDKFHRDEHGDQVAPCHESEHTDEEQQGAEDEEIFYWYHITCPFLK